MSRRRLILASISLAVGIIAPTALTQLTKVERQRAEIVIKKANPSVFARIPTLKPGLSAQEQADAVIGLEIGMRRMTAELKNVPNVPPEVNEGVRAWEALTRAQRTTLLKGNPAQLRAFTPVAA